jgi:Ubiquitin carboxyl-terminal hydrolase
MDVFDLPSAADTGAQYFDRLPIIIDCQKRKARPQADIILEAKTSSRQFLLGSASSSPSGEGVVVNSTPTTTSRQVGFHNIRNSCWLGAALQVILQLSVTLGGLDKLTMSNRLAFELILKLEATVDPTWCSRVHKSPADLKAAQLSLLRELIKVIPYTDATRQHDASMLFEGIFDVRAASRAIEFTTVWSYRCAICFKESSSVREPSLTLDIRESADDVQDYPGMQTIQSYIGRVQDKYEDLQTEIQTPRCCGQQERERAFRYATGSPFLFVKHQLFNANDMGDHIVSKGKAIEEVVQKFHTSYRFYCDMVLVLNKVEYILQSVILHIGDSMASGHYLNVYREDLRVNFWQLADDQSIQSLGASKSTILLDLPGLLQKIGYENANDPYICTYVRSQDANISSGARGDKRSKSAASSTHDEEGLVTPAHIRISGTPGDSLSSPSPAVEVPPPFKKTRMSFNEILSSTIDPVENYSTSRKRKVKKPAPVSAPPPTREGLKRSTRRGAPEK